MSAEHLHCPRCGVAVNPHDAADSKQLEIEVGHSRAQTLRNVFRTCDVSRFWSWPLCHTLTTSRPGGPLPVFDNGLSRADGFAERVFGVELPLETPANPPSPFIGNCWWIGRDERDDQSPPLKRGGIAVGGPTGGGKPFIRTTKVTRAGWRRGHDIKQTGQSEDWPEG